jgi:hypothetical protein
MAIWRDISRLLFSLVIMTTISFVGGIHIHISMAGYFVFVYFPF